MKFLFLILSMIYINAEEIFVIQKDFETKLRSEASFEIVPTEKNMFSKMTIKQIQSHFGLLPSSHNQELVDNGRKILDAIQSERNSHNHSRVLSVTSYTDNSTSLDNNQARTLQGTNSDDIEFDLRYKYPFCIGDVRNQGSCQSGSPHSAVNTFSTTFSIFKDVHIFQQFSIQEIVSCDPLSYGCSGGHLESPFYYIEKYGIKTDSCIPYTSGTGIVPPCPTQCVNSNQQMEKYRCLPGTIVDLANNIGGMKSWLRWVGPLSVGFEIYQDFLYYLGGIYHHISGPLIGLHAATLIGYNTSYEGVDYWILKNSWGDNWGEHGYFRMKIGECSIEQIGAISCKPESIIP